MSTRYIAARVSRRFTANPLRRAIAFGMSSSFALAAIAEETSGQRSLEEVMVVGQKTERSLQDTAASVKVVTAENIVEENINGLYDVLERTPNVAGALGSDFSIRGINAFTVSGGGNSYLTSVYSDGAVLPYRAIQEGGFSTWDVQQVEVLRGPQSTLQGRNALAGAIVMNTVDPTYDWTFRGRLGAGEEGREEKAMAFGGAIIEDQLAFRIAAEDRDFDGFNRNITRGENSDFERDQTLRLKVLAEPAALPGLRALLTLTSSETDNGVKWINPGAGDPFENRETTFNDPTHEFTESDMAVLKLGYELGEHWDFTSTSAYSDVYYGYEWDGDVGPEPAQTLVDDREDKTFSQEFLFNFDYENLSGVIGAYYSDLDVEDVYSGNRSMTQAELGLRETLIYGFGLPETVVDSVLPLYAGLEPVILDTYGLTLQQVESQAIFADLTYSVNSRLDLLTGLRYDRESQANEADTQIAIANDDAMPNPADYALDPALQQLITGINGAFFAMAADASGTEPLVEDDFSAVLPKLGATWHWSDDMSTSLIAQKGYRSGGVGSNIAQNYTYVYDPEYTWNYELSFRSLWMDGRLAANANLFYLDWEDQQVNVQLSGNTFDNETVNSGRSTVRGLEVELFYQANEHWSGNAGFGYSDTEFDEFVVVLPSGTFDLSGRDFGGAPEHTANLGVTYRGDSGFLFNANANYQAESLALANPYGRSFAPDSPYFDPENDARWLVNLRTGYEWKNLGAYLTVTNLLDEEYVSAANTGSSSMVLGAPRLATLRLEANF